MTKFEAPAIKEWDFMMVKKKKKKTKKICMEKVVGKQGLALQQHFPFSTYTGVV